MENFDNLLKAVDGLEQKIAKLEETAKEANNKLLNALKTAKPVSKYGVSEESCMKFIKLTRALLAGDIAEAKVVSGASNATGGYLIPTEVAGTILSIVPQYSVALRYSTIFPMGSKNVNIPKAVANLYDYVVDEGV
ncbi:MAG TPA: phage major capsid protein, partial [bacterium]|nr:phage major capsid protein [bacterium]